jgi:hypothetical protein
MSNLDSQVEAFKNDMRLSEEDAEQFVHYLQEGNKYLRDVVGVREFVESPHYLDCKDILYPAIMDSLEELNSGKYSEAVLTGGIGCGKSTIALYTNAYSLYLLSCMRSPHREFGLDPSSEIMFIFQNLNMSLAKAVDYERFRALIDRAPYFQKHFPYNKDIKSQLEFPHRIIVKPVVGTVSGTIGQNVIGGLIDEVNFMENVQKSKKSADGGSYDQADTLYNSMARRRESRFMSGGKLPGILCLVSSKCYPGEFTDRKIEEAKTDPSIYVYDKRIWDVKPQGTFSEETFEVFVGDLSRNPFIITEENGEELYETDEHLIIQVPIEFRKRFDQDILDALREIGGVALRSVRPFITDVTAIADASGKVRSALTLDEVDFSTQVLKIRPKRIKFPDEQRYVHIDLGVTHDHCGVVMGCVPKFVEMDRGGGLIEKLPHIHIDFAINIKPPKNGEIDFGKIRGLIYKLREIGVPLKWVSLDSFQSVDMIQRLKAKGFISGVLSMDKTITPYIFCKNALLDRRVAMPEHEKLQKELRELELNEEKAKVDHPPQGSSDVSDALAGVIYGLTIRRELWFRHLDSVVEMHEFQKRYLAKPIEQNDYQTV